MPTAWARIVLDWPSTKAKLGKGVGKEGMGVWLTLYAATTDVVTFRVFALSAGFAVPSAFPVGDPR